MPPPLDELLTRTPLPESDSYYEDYEVEGIPVCGADDSPMDERRRVLVSSEDPTVYFPNASDVSSETTFLNIDDSLYRRILTATGGFRYNRVATGASGNEVPLGTGVVHLCRSDDEDGEGRYEVYVTDNALINNAPGNPPALARVPIALHFDEITAIIHGLHRPNGEEYRIPSDHYLIDPANPTQLSLMPIPSEIEEIASMVEAENSPIHPDRRATVAAAIRRTPWTPAEEFQQDMMDSQDSMRWELRIMQGLMMYLMAKQMGLTARFDSMAERFFHAAMGTPGRVMRGDFMGARRLWSVLFTPTSRVSRDMTESLSRLSSPLTAAAEGIIVEFDRGAFPHVILSGPSGSGKGHAARAAGAAIVQGNSEVEAFEDGRVGFRQISASAIVREAGSWLNRAEEIFFRELDNAARSGRPEIIYLTEADGFAEAGMGAGNQPLNLLKKIYEITEGGDGRYRNLHFLLDSTRWEVIERAAPDLLRRTGFVEVAPPLPQELRSALDIAISLRRSGSEGAILQRRYNQMTFTPEALDAIAALGHFERGAPPSSHLTVMDGLVAEMSRAHRGSSDSVEITAADVISHVARRTHSSETRVEADFRSVMAVGIENNPVIQSRILEGFYRAYPNPRNGFRNPLFPNTETLYDGEGREMPRGSYRTINEAMAAGRSGAARSVPPPPTSTASVASTRPNPMAEVLTRPIDMAAIESALAGDPVLAEFYRSHVLSAPQPITTVGEFLSRMMSLDSTALTQARQAMTAEGILVPDNPERLIFETLTRAAASRGGWTAPDPLERSVRATAFEGEIRRSRSPESGGSEPSEAARREAEERARRERESRSR